MRRSTYSTYSVSTPTPWLKWVGATLIFGSFIMLMWFATSNKDSLLKNENDLELIMPLSGSVKVRAGDPGGMEIANRDKQVFDLLDNSSEATVNNESLCESAEGEMVCNKKLPKITPLAADPKAVAAAKLTSKLKAKNTDIAMLISNYEQTKADAKAKAKAKKMSAVVDKPNKQVIAPTTIKTVETVKAPKGVKMIAKEKLFTGGAWGVQLASYKSLIAADKGSKILLKRFGELLKNLTYVTERIDIKDKGTFYRVQFIGLKDKTSAKKICDEVKLRKQGCWYVSR